MQTICVLPKHRFDAVLVEAGINDSNVDANTNLAFISIQNSKAIEPGVCPYFKHNHKHALTLTFDDITDKDIDVLIQYPGSVLFNETQARDVVEFVEANISCDFILHCTAGISRSGAVGEYIRRKLGINYEQYKHWNPNTLPNSWVLQLLTRVGESGSAMQTKDKEDD